jgi:ketosteroid isomerase-like protein
MPTETVMEQGADAVRRELQAAYAQAGDAWKQKDAAGIMRLVTPDFGQTMPGGETIPHAVAEEGLKAWFDTTDAVQRYAVRIDAMSVSGDEAVATVAEDVATTFADPAGGKHERVQANTSRMTWVRTPEGWRIRRSDYLTGTMTVDGRVVEG